MAEIDQRQRKDVQTQQSFCEKLNKELAEVEVKMDKLVNGYLDATIDKAIYTNKKVELIKTKVDLEAQLKNFSKKGGAWFELSREWVKAAVQAGKLASSDDLFEIKSFLKKNGSNRLLKDKKVELQFIQPFDLASKYKPFKQKTPHVTCGAGVLPSSVVVSSRVDIPEFEPNC